MDVVINSLVQSPLVRTMETVASKANSFTHHIPDNCPPHSEAKITVQAREADPNDLTKSNTMTYDIPAYGYLRRAVVKVSFTVQENAGTATLYNKFGLYALIDRIELKSRNRPIQKVYGRNQYCKDLWKGGSEFERKLHMARLKDTTTFKILEVISNKAPMADVAGAITNAQMRLAATGDFYSPGITHELPPHSAQYVTAYFEIDLASTVDLSHNYNTRFVEPIQVSVIFRPTSSIIRQIAVAYPIAAVAPESRYVPLYCPPDNWDYWSQSPTSNTTLNKFNNSDASGFTPGSSSQLVSSFKAVLLCYYLNFHDITEVDIRNANFKPEVPALVFQYDTVEEPSQALDVDTSFSADNGPINSSGYINTSNGCIRNTDVAEAAPTSAPLLNSFASAQQANIPTFGLNVAAASVAAVATNDEARTNLGRTAESMSNSAHQVSTVLDNLNAPGVQVCTKDIKISSNNLAYSISVLCDIDEFPLHFMPTISQVTMTGSGQTIYNATGYENSLVDRLEEPLQTLQGKPDQGCGAAMFQYNQDNLIYGSMPDMGNGNSQGFKLVLTKCLVPLPAAPDAATLVTNVTAYNALTLNTSTSSITGIIPTNNLLSLSRSLNRRVQKSLQNPALIRFSLSSDPTYNSGAVGLQTIANPKITVKVMSNEFAMCIAGRAANAAVAVAANSNSAATVKAIAAFRIFTYVNHHAIVQIDSGTGAITRSIDA